MENPHQSSERSKLIMGSVSNRIVKTALCAILLTFLALGATAAPPEACSNLQNFSMPNVMITSARIVAAGSFYAANRGATPVSGLPAFCRVAGTLTPTKDSEIAIEVWMPVSGWNGKLQSIGNHQLGGAIFYGDMATQLKRNFAVASTDTGHTDPDNASWASGHPEKAIDFGWRAVHEMTMTAKAIITAFYGAKPKFSYFDGCSSGGREALKEAQRFPEDYDGIISGSAMNYWTHSHLVHIWAAQVLLQDGLKGAHYIPSSKYNLIVNAALTHCKPLETGVPTDSFLMNPSRCGWDPKTIVCKPGQDAGTCITAAQAESLDKIYAPLRNPRTKAELYPGSTKSNEPSWAAWATRPGTSPDGHNATGPAQQYFQWIVFDKPNWDWRTLKFDSDVAFVDESDATGPQIDAIDPNLKAFREHGGKLIQYHGWLDAGFSPNYAVQYYESVMQAIGSVDGSGSDDALHNTQEFYRLFMAPGMKHCTGGPGPNAFGGLAQPEVKMDPQHDVVSALEEWVEHGAAPAEIVATKYVNDDPAQGIAMQRPLCPYPEESQYKGTGSTSDASSFVCVAETKNSKRPSSRPARAISSLRPRQ